MKYYYLPAVLLLLMSSKALAQYGEVIGTPRPGASNGAGTVGKGILQFQAGIRYDESNFDTDSSKIKIGSISENLVVRFGLAERFEVSTVLNYNNTTRTNKISTEETSLSGLNTSLIRARLVVVQNLSIQAGVNVPIFENDFKRDKLAPKMRVMYSTRFTENLRLTTNLGAQWDGFNKDPSGFYVFSFSANLPGAFSLIAESFGNFRRTQLNNFYDIGLGYLVNNDMLIDLNAGWGNNFGVSSYYVTAGISFRMVTAYRK